MRNKETQWELFSLRLFILNDQADCFANPKNDTRAADNHQPVAEGKGRDVEHLTAEGDDEYLADEDTACNEVESLAAF